MNDCRQCEKEEIARAGRCHVLENEVKARGEDFTCECGPTPPCTHTYEAGIALGMAIGAAILAWAEVLKKRENDRCVLCGRTGQAVSYDPYTNCRDREDLAECDRLEALAIARGE